MTFDPGWYHEPLTLGLVYTFVLSSGKGVPGFHQRILLRAELRPLQTSDIGTPTSNMTIFGDRAFKEIIHGHQGHKDGALILWD